MNLIDNTVNAWADYVANHYGEAQKIIALEEMGELTQAVTKDIRGKPDYNNLAEEIGDVYLMLAQLIILYDLKEEVKTSVISKMIRTLGGILNGED